MAYKKDQGRMVRMAAFWSLAALLFYAASSLRDTMVALSPEGLGRAIGGMRVPILGMDLTPALCIAVLALGLGLWLLYRWEEKPKNADLLIDTESELRKVTWPSIEETINGSWTVVITVLFLMMFLAGTDWVLARLAARILRVGS